jgi:hypothetical protein
MKTLIINRTHIFSRKQESDDKSNNLNKEIFMENLLYVKRSVTYGI